jgi:hypothetical protein
MVPDQPHPHIHNIFRIAAQMLLGQAGAEKHSEQRTTKTAGEHDQANGD